MNIAFPAFGAALAALFVWLSIRFVNRREKWVKRTLLAFTILPALYLLSFGVACAIVSRSGISTRDVFGVPMLPDCYQPLGWMGQNGPEFARDGICDYARFWMPTSSVVGMPAGENDGFVILKAGSADDILRFSR